MKRKILLKLLIASSALAVLVTLNLAPLLSPPPTIEYKEGDVLNKDLYASISFPIPKDSVRLSSEQDSAAALVLPVLVLDTAAESTVSQRLSNLRFPDSVPATFSAKTKELLLSTERDSLIAAAERILKTIFSQGYSLDKDKINSQSVIIVMGGKEIQESTASILGLEDFETLVNTQAKAFFPYNRAVVTALNEIFLRIAAPNPNLRINMEETRARQQAAREKISPYEGFVEKGTLLAEANSRIDKTVLKKIEALNRAMSGDWKLRIQLILKQNVLFIMIVFMFGAALFLLVKKVGAANILFMTLLLIVGIVASFALRRFSIWWFAPAGFIALAVAVFLSPLQGILITAATSLLFFLPWQVEPDYLVYFLLTALGAFMSYPVLKRRLGFVFFLGFVFAGGLMARALFFLTAPQPSLRDLLNVGLEASINAALNTLFLLAAYLLGERVFGFTSSIALRELADLNRPLFKQFALRAAGSYHHSIVVGNLSEQAARELNANAALALAGGYYHDIGKMTKPQYFIENQLEENNPHDTLKPRISALILAHHVKDGMVIASRNHLPRPIKEIITQHHGTTKMEFFYQKALVLSTDKEVQEEDFRYPGPRPQTKEAAIVMLADTVEAAIRAEGFKDKEDLEQKVKKLINMKVEDGQLDECNFTTADIHSTMKIFSNTLLGIYHPRVKYEKKNNSSDTEKDKKKRSAKTGKKNT